MSVYAFMSMAGSTGKSASLGAFAWLLAQQGLKVRLIDFDAQANTSTVYGYPYYQGLTVGDVVREKASIGEVEVFAQRYIGVDADTNEIVYEPIPNLTVVPTYRKALTPLISELSGAKVNRLRKALVVDADQRPEAQPDITLIDCGGTESPLLIAGALATSAFDDDDRPGAWGVITCAKPAGKEIEGIPDLIESLADWRETYNRQLELVAVVPTIIPAQGGRVAKEDEPDRYQFRIGGGYREMLTDLEAEYADALIGGVTPPIRRTVQVDHAYSARTPLVLFKPSETRDIMDDYAVALAHLQKRGVFVPRSGLPTRKAAV
ncbi:MULTISPECIES: ParA family protein [unclassified Nocardia]|uniref:ParA family protein n=1 Tax=unclassified Nocardia TaxID=2637762 RepID=UPI001CE421EE|nr:MULTISPECIES: ParA family protein [unclassified Nocardia]